MDIDWIGGPGDLDILLKQSDYVVLSLPLNAESAGLINEKTLKQDSFLINVSRGGLVDYHALKSALEQKQIAGAGLDVFWEEPPDPAMIYFNTISWPRRISVVPSMFPCRGSQKVCKKYQPDC